MKDPYNKQERGRYKNPIASREAILAHLKANQSGLSLTKISKGFDKKAMLARLNAMLRDGQIILKKDCYISLASSVKRGYVIIRHDGCGMVRADEQDYILPPRQALGLMRGDLVKFRTSTKAIKRKPIGILISIVQRSNSQLIAEVKPGVVQLFPGQIGGSGIIKADTAGFKLKDNVFIKVKEFPKTGDIGSCQIISKVPANLDMRIWAALLHGLPFEFSLEILAEADNLPLANIEGRKDLRHLPFVTIDGETAKDFDDAVYVKATPGSGYVLYVAIADVASYVQSGSKIDQAAFERATSVYFPGQVIPMLPEQLSNNLCSLLPEQDRAVLVAEMAITEDGKRKRSRLYQGLINSHARLTYKQVTAFNENSSLVPEFWQQVFADMSNLCAVLMQKKQARGALTIARSEQQIILADDGSVANVQKSDSLIAHAWIEVCMLEANEAVAEFLVKKTIPGLYREHGEPKLDKLEELEGILKNFGVGRGVKTKDVSKKFQYIINEIERLSLPDSIMVLLLRALPQASYTHKQLPHFGLAYTNYCHFTSPIRRYPDLLVHRQIIKQLTGENTSIGNIDDIAQHCSFAERRADQAARDVTKRYVCQFIADKVGQEFDGVVSTVLDFGMFIELSNCGIEGLLHISNLGDDRFSYDAESQSLFGQFSGVSYSIGDKISVKIASVNQELGQIDLFLAKF